MPIWLQNLEFLLSLAQTPADKLHLLFFFEPLTQAWLDRELVAGTPAVNRAASVYRCVADFNLLTSHPLKPLAKRLQGLTAIPSRI